jgi:hypothetical protein
MNKNTDINKNNSDEYVYAYIQVEAVKKFQVKITV